MPITQQEIVDYVEENIPRFHESRINGLKNLKLKTLLKKKNPYLFRARNINAARELIQVLLDAHLSSSDEGMFGAFLEGLAIFICSRTFNGIKSASEGIDLEFEHDQIRYIVSIKSGPNWGNSSQINKMKDNFIKAKRILKTNTSSTNVVAVNGCCYGKDNKPDKGEYLKYCGQEFWEFISGDSTLYLAIIEPLGYKARENNQHFEAEYNNVIDRFTDEFSQQFCNAEGQIVWERILQLNSEKKS